MPLITLYLRIWFVSTLSIILTVVIINLLVDPYGLYQLFDRPGFNMLKPSAREREAMVKSHGVEKIKPNAIILGNSRAEIGLDPQYSGWSTTAKPVYNLALPGSGLAISLLNLQHAIAVNPPKIVVLGIDFLDFRMDSAHSALPLDQHTLAAAQDRLLSWPQKIRDYVDTLLSLDALFDSYTTLRAQQQPHSPSLTALGLNSMLDYEGLAMQQGYKALFQQKDSANSKSYLHGPHDIFIQDSDTSPDFEDLHRLLQVCRKSHIRLNLIIYPYHAHMLEIFRNAGLWTAFEDWKRKLVKILAEDSKMNPGFTPYPLWDFSGYNPYTSESIPIAGDIKSKMQWYWESGHFKKALGDLMLRRVLDEDVSDEAGADMFGVVLTPANIELQLARIRGERQRYLKSHTQDVQEMSDLIQ